MKMSRQLVWTVRRVLSSSGGSERDHLLHIRLRLPSSAAGCLGHRWGDLIKLKNTAFIMFVCYFRIHVPWREFNASLELEMFSFHVNSFPGNNPLQNKKKKKTSQLIGRCSFKVNKWKPEGIFIFVNAAFAQALHIFTNLTVCKRSLETPVKKCDYKEHLAVCTQPVRV